MLICSTRASQDLPSGLTLDLIRAQARVGTLEDSLLLAYANAALDLAEQHTGRAFTEREVVAEFDAFPAGGGVLEVPLGAIDEVSEVRYTDSATTTAVIDPVPDFVNGARAGLRVPAAGWPTLYGGAPAWVRVTYTTEPLPMQGAVLAAVLLLITHLYENRAATTEQALSELPMGASALLDTLRIYRV